MRSDAPVVMSADVCVICMDALDQRAPVTLDCDHTFHAECAVQWFRAHNTTCPLCRADDIWGAWHQASRTPMQVVAAVRRRRAPPTHLRVPLRRLDALDASIRAQTSALSAIMRTHGHAVRRATSIRVKLRRARCEKRRVARDVAYLHRYHV